MTSSSKLSIVVLISGNGSNLQAIIDAARQDARIHIAAVISNTADAYGLIRAQTAGIATHVISHRDNSSADFEKKMQETIASYHPQLIVLAGFMRRLSAAFVEHFPWKIINIHPSLLPKYPGLHTYRRALENGDTEHGISIHFVDEKLDAGPLICQMAIPILADDNEESLKKRTQVIEHKIYPEVIQWFATGRLQVVQDKIYWDGKPLIEKDFNTINEQMLLK